MTDEERSRKAIHELFEKAPELKKLIEEAAKNGTLRFGRRRRY